MKESTGVWLPCIKSGTGVDVFTMRLAEALNKKGVKAEIAWLPKTAELAPYLFRVPQPPSWATIVHISSGLNPRFVPNDRPLVVTSHGCVHDESAAKYKSLAQKIYHRVILKRRELKNFNAALVVTAVSHYTADKITTYFKLKDVKIIKNWIDPDLSFQAEFHRNRDEPVKLLFVGKASKRKGFDMLPAIMEELGTGYEMHILGKVDRRWSNKLICHGYVSDFSKVIKFYKECNYLVFPSRLEGLSLAALEAMACGLPIISSDSSSFPELVDNGVNGFLCKADSVSEFVSSISRLGINSDEYNSLSIEATRKVTEEFSQDKSVKMYIDIYNRLLDF